MSRTVWVRDPNREPFKLTKDRLIEVAESNKCEEWWKFELGIPKVWIEEYELQSGINGRSWKQSPFWDAYALLSRPGEPKHEWPLVPPPSGGTRFDDHMTDD